MYKEIDMDKIRPRPTRRPTRQDRIDEIMSENTKALREYVITQKWLRREAKELINAVHEWEQKLANTNLKIADANAQIWNLSRRLDRLERRLVE